MGAKARYDFESYITLIERDPRMKDVIDAIDPLIRSHLRLAFEKFGSEGEWGYQYPTGQIEWVAEYLDDYRDTHWGGEFPVRISISPEEFESAVEDWIDDTDMKEMMEHLRKWQGAVERSISACKKKMEDG